MDPDREQFKLLRGDIEQIGEAIGSRIAKVIVQEIKTGRLSPGWWWKSGIALAIAWALALGTFYTVSPKSDRVDPSNALFHVAQALDGNTMQRRNGTERFVSVAGRLNTIASKLERIAASMEQQPAAPAS